MRRSVRSVALAGIVFHLKTCKLQRLEHLTAITENFICRCSIQPQHTLSLPTLQLSVLVRLHSSPQLKIGRQLRYKWTTHFNWRQTQPTTTCVNSFRHSPHTQDLSWVWSEHPRASERELWVLRTSKHIIYPTQGLIKVKSNKIQSLKTLYILWRHTN